MIPIDEAAAREAAHDILDQLRATVTLDTVVALLTGEDYELDPTTADRVAGRAVELITGATVTLPGGTRTD